MSESLTWKYHAEGTDGNLTHGKLMAMSEAQALILLKEKKLKPIDLMPVRTTSFANLIKRTTRLSGQEITNLARDISDLLEAGIPLGEMLSMLEIREKPGPTKSLLERLRYEIRNGSNLSTALKKDPVNLPRLMIAMTEVGEATGTLGAQMSRFTEAQEKAQTLRRDLMGQLLYPLVLCLMVILTIFFLSFFVLPEFETIFNDGQTRAPPETKLILNMGAWIRQWGAIIPLIIASFTLLGQWIFKHNRQTLENIILRLPFIGPFFFILESGKFCRGLGVMLQGGMAIVPALEIARKALLFETLRIRHQLAADSVRAGGVLSQSLTIAKALHEENIRFIELGERTGDLDVMVTKAASTNEVKVKTSLKRFTDLLSPILTILMGLVTAGVIGSVMSGVLSLNETVY